MIYLGSELYGIDYKNIISLITIESEWNPLAYNYNKNGTTDYGLCQINSIHISENYNVARSICDKYKVSYSKDIYDVKLNILSAFIYLNDTRNELVALKDFNKQRWIISYNCGVFGSSSKKYEVSANKYWDKFIKIRGGL
jgi:hypothetical protein